MDRRTFLMSGSAILAAPAFCRADWLMSPGKLRAPDVFKNVPCNLLSVNPISVPVPIVGDALYKDNEGLFRYDGRRWRRISYDKFVATRDNLAALHVNLAASVLRVDTKNNRLLINHKNRR